MGAAHAGAQAHHAIAWSCTVAVTSSVHGPQQTSLVPVHPTCYSTRAARHPMPTQLPVSASHIASDPAGAQAQPGPTHLFHCNQARTTRAPPAEHAQQPSKGRKLQPSHLICTTSVLRHIASQTQHTHPACNICPSILTFSPYNTYSIMHTTARGVLACMPLHTLNVPATTPLLRRHSHQQGKQVLNCRHTHITLEQAMLVISICSRHGNIARFAPVWPRRPRLAAPGLCAGVDKGRGLPRGQQHARQAKSTHHLRKAPATAAALKATWGIGVH